jgi:hypothetical protein
VRCVLNDPVSVQFLPGDLGIAPNLGHETESGACGKVRQSVRRPFLAPRCPGVIAEQLEATSLGLNAPDLDGFQTIVPEYALGANVDNAFLIRFQTYCFHVSVCSATGFSDDRCVACCRWTNSVEQPDRISQFCNVGGWLAGPRQFFVIGADGETAGKGFTQASNRRAAIPQGGFRDVLEFCSSSIDGFGDD